MKRQSVWVLLAVLLGSSVQIHAAGPIAGATLTCEAVSAALGADGETVIYQRVQKDFTFFQEGGGSWTAYASPSPKTLEDLGITLEDGTFLMLNLSSNDGKNIKNAIVGHMSAPTQEAKTLNLATVSLGRNLVGDEIPRKEKGVYRLEVGLLDTRRLLQGERPAAYNMITLTCNQKENKK